MSDKPWERNPKNVAKARERAATAAVSAKRSYSRAVTTDVTKRVTQDVALIIAREYVKHGDMRHALIVTGFVDEDTSDSNIRKIAQKVRKSKNFAEAFDEVVGNFENHEILTRERILAGLFVEASDRFGPTSAAARVSAWSKLAQLTGMEAGVKPGQPDPNKALESPGGVLLIPFAPSIESWEQSAMAMQAQLKADVRT